MTAEASKPLTPDDRCVVTGPTSPSFAPAWTLARARDLPERPRQSTVESAARDTHQLASETDVVDGRAENNSQWTRALTDPGPAREAAADALYAYLLRAARSELAHRASTS